MPWKQPVYTAVRFFPYSIGAFGPLPPAEDTPQDTIQHPNTLYMPDAIEDAVQLMEVDSYRFSGK